MVLNWNLQKKCSSKVLTILNFSCNNCFWSLFSDFLNNGIPLLKSLYLFICVFYPYNNNINYSNRYTASCNDASETWRKISAACLISFYLFSSFFRWQASSLQYFLKRTAGSTFSRAKLTRTKDYILNIELLLSLLFKHLFCVRWTGLCPRNQGLTHTSVIYFPQRS